MAKLTLNNVSSGYNSNTQMNTNNAAIIAALENTLSRDGTTPNTMSADIDLNSNDLLNVKAVYADNIYLDGTLLSHVVDPSDATVSTFMTTVLDDTTASAARTTLDAARLGGTNTFTGNQNTSNSSVVFKNDGRTLGWEVLSSQDASASGTIAFGSAVFDATKYDAYMFALMNVTPATDAVDFYIRTSSNGGSTYDNGVGHYVYAFHGLTAGGTAANNTSGSDTKILAASGVGSDVNERGISGEVFLLGPHLTVRTIMNVDLGFFNSSGGFTATNGAGYRTDNADVDGVEFRFSSGNIESGTITMYGLRNG